MRINCKITIKRQIHRSNNSRHDIHLTQNGIKMINFLKHSNSLVGKGSI